jgi:hypothetical protein
MAKAIKNLNEGAAAASCFTSNIFIFTETTGAGWTALLVLTFCVPYPFYVHMRLLRFKKTSIPSSALLVSA